MNAVKETLFTQGKNELSVAYFSTAILWDLMFALNSFFFFFGCELLVCEKISTDFSFEAFNEINGGFSLKAVIMEMMETLVI